MSRVGMTVDPYKGIPLPVLFRFVRWAGVRHAEVTPKFLFSHSFILRSIRGMSLGFHLPNAGLDGYDFSSNSYQSEIKDVITRVSNLSKHVQFKYAVCHPPESPKKDRSLSLYFQSLRELNLPLVLENIQSCAGHDFIRFHAQCQQELNDQLLGVCLDVSHARLSGDNWQNLFQLFKSQIQVIHLSDIQGREDKHAPFRDDSTLSLHSILDYLLEQKYKGVLNFEILPEGLHGIIQMFRNIRQAQKLFDC
ncbi:TIM barrel protein [candidate division KSB1 bacterium]|nr:TIM barrel protein [candidate division KSB1 bacterium]